MFKLGFGMTVGGRGKKVTAIKQVVTETGKQVITDTGKILFVKIGA